MNTMALVGILVILYAVFVIFIAVKKPEKVWNMKKIELFKKVLGEKGTVIFFYIWGIAFVLLGVWLMTKK
ncbi:hypothetical protein [Oceanirhabdus sp. W0125-5]|uniref:hypothetical protein n=1 Tax=Oceanirhabdus sp. W0125-5 TaxID=2999116 RepID=UPI0022F2F1B2|nr:hypothetical protein [Oceanirhabdus sp. W0125-5]WBW95635.1 hypothetical protein OW730_18320 [Oceanirhabdus sp. W0125-5]